MIVMQTLLLHVALANRSYDTSTPFAAPKDGVFGFSKRPCDFWQWKSERPYWSFLAYFTVALVALQYIFGAWQLYISTIGYLALTIEATLPLPQILSNHRNSSCKGFRLSVLINWLVGDVMKLSFFFLSDSTIPWAFKLCGLFQFGCDMYLGVQYLQFEKQTDMHKLFAEKAGGLS